MMQVWSLARAILMGRGKGKCPDPVCMPWSHNRSAGFNPQERCGCAVRLYTRDAVGLATALRT